MPLRPSTEQLLVQVLLRAAEDLLRLYESEEVEDAELVRARTELELAFAPIWSRMPVLDLGFAGDQVLWNGEPVLTGEDDAHGLVPSLLASGIHGLRLVPGVEREEMARFLELVHRVRRLDEDGDQDLVLMLFRADLHHVQYTVGPVLDPAIPTPAPPAAAQDLPPGPPTATPTPSASRTPGTDVARLSPSEVRKRIQEDLRAPAPGTHREDDLDSASHFLDAADIDYLKSAIDREYEQDHSESVLALLLDTLELRAEPDVRDEVIRVLRAVLPYLLGTGRFPAVAYLTSELRGITRTTTFEPRHREALDQLRASISDADALRQLFHVLDDGTVEPTPEELGALLQELRQDAIGSVLVWLGQLRRPKAKSALLEALEAFFTQWPMALEKMTTATDRAVVQRALAIAGRVQDPAFAEPISAALEHVDPATRRLAVSALAAIATPASLKLMARAIDDVDAEVRKKAYDALAQRHFRPATTKLAAAIASPDLESRDLSERRALFSAYAVAAGPAGVATLEPILLGKGGLARRASPMTRACAALALSLIDTPAARFALKNAATDKDPLVRSAAGSALRAERTAS
jgi:hypothetical protein